MTTTKHTQTEVADSNSYMNRIYANLGENIKNIRKQHKLNQDEFGAQLELSRISIANIEKGRQKPTIHMIFYIMLKFDVKLEDIFPVKFLNHLKLREKLPVENKPKTHLFISELSNLV